MEIKEGRTYPFGATLIPEGINFSVYAKNADLVRLCLFHENDSTTPFEKIDLRCTGEIWHGLVQGLTLPLVYGYEVVRKDQTKLLLDPYATSIASEPKWQNPSRDSFIYRPLGKIVNHSFNWGEEIPLTIPKKDLIIYEMHVRGLTRHESSSVEFPGTFKGIIEKVPYLVELGINAIELMPIFEFCEEDVVSSHPETKSKLHNYYGYSSINLFSVMNRYASETSNDASIIEFKTLVKELHKNGIKVILDVVYNHTLEGNEQGPILSYKGLDEASYYMLDKDHHYLNFSGCGNTVNCNHPITAELIMQSLRYWVLEYHIDGFRFDLASVFNRGEDGVPIEHPLLMEFLSKDPVLSNTLLIAEPWDAGGLYQLGKFAPYGGRWTEWNGKFRDSVRNFIKGAPLHKGLFSSALTGSTELYPNSPFSSINYVVSHDGFTLHDLVSYNEKHNQVNGENNQDGTNQNDSWNCGHEGETKNKRVLNLRQRQVRNFHLALMLSQGIPMLYMGDECLQTKLGNNNAWCQDNEENWFLWDKLKENENFYNFYKFLIHFRKSHPLLHIENHWTEKEVKWHGLKVGEPDWEKDDQLVAFSLHYPSGEPGLYAAFNASHLNQEVSIPNHGEGKRWQWVVNTKNTSPNDYYDENRYVELMENSYRVAPYSSILLNRPLA